MKRTRYINSKWRVPPSRSVEDVFADLEPNPVSVELYRIMQPGRTDFLTTLPWYERSLADVQARFGGGLYKIVVRYRGRVRGARVFEISGPPIDDRT